MWRTASAVVLLVGLHVETVLAQSPLGACRSAISAEEITGLLKVAINAPCRRGESVRLALGVSEYEAEFSDDGVAKLTIVLAEPVAKGDLLYRDGTTEAIDIPSPRLSDVLRISLVWDVPVDLNLHVVEPGGSLNGAGDAGVADATTSIAGRLDHRDDASGTYPFIESYVFADRSTQPSGVFSVAVENLTRGRSPAGDDCGDGESARVDFTLVVADRGRITRNSYELPAAPCGTTLSDDAYFMRVRF